MGEALYIAGLTIFFLIFTAVLAYVSSAATALRAQTLRERDELLSLGADTIVRAVEQTAWINNLGGDQKKSAALLLMDTWTSEIGIDLSFDHASLIVEAAVNRMNASGGEIDTEIVTEWEPLEE